MPVYPLGVYIAATAHPVLVAGVAIVGTPIREWFARDGDDPEDADPTRLVVDYETPAGPPATFADAAAIAAARHVEHAETDQRLVVPAAAMTEVATFHATHGRLDVAGASALVLVARWLRLDVDRAADRDRLAATLQCRRP